MAKTESTAVNSLIELVQSNQTKPIIDPSDDLFAAPKGKVPALRSAGEVAPLPRSRAPGGTSQLTLPEHMPSVRSTTAPPSRGTTIPPIPRVTGAAAPQRPTTLPEGTPPPAIQARPATPRPSAPALPPPVRATSAPALPPPARTTPAPAPKRASAPSPSAGSAKRTSSVSPSAGTPKRASSPSPQALYAKSQTGPVAATSLGAVAPLTYPMQARIDMTGDMVRGDEWFEASRAVEKFEDETYVGTSPHVLHDRRAETSLVKKLILPGLGFIIVGALIGGFIAFNSSGKKNVVAKAPIAHVTPATEATAQNAALAAEVAHGANTGVPAPSVPTGVSPERVAAAVPAETPDTHEVQTTRGVVHLTDVRIDSMPAGATVTLVEKTATGETKSFLGTTPIATSLDPSRHYEVVLALAGRPEQTAKLDPAHTPHLQIALGKATKAAPAQAAIAKAAPAQAAIAKATPAPAAVRATPAPKHHSAPPKTEQLADPGFDSAPAPEAPAAKPEKPAAAAGANGTLMISSKPPCEILIDGKSTGLTTPQRAISLPAGAHKVTLSNSDANVTKTLMVQINPGQSTKLVKDLTN